MQLIEGGNNIKKKIIITAIVLLMSITLVGCGNKKNKENEEKNILLNIGNVEGMELKNTEVKFENESTYVTSELTNKTKSSKKVDFVKAYITYESEGVEEMVNLLIYFGTTIKPNETAKATTLIDLDLSTAIKVEYSFMEEE